ncbi:MAG: hypothetical protein JWQ99_3413 [Blastococcus sp.]|jgi:hypothetical protein|nr:hypothetical protein [Blastococcus sp.]
MRFATRVEGAGKTATGLPVPDEVVEALAAGRRPAVRVTLGGHTYRSTVAARGGRYLVPLSAENRAAAGVAAGDDVEVELEVDTEPREVTVPADLAAALEHDEPARRSFERLAYSHQLRHVLAVEAAKAPETRRRRIDKTLEMLREG